MLVFVLPNETKLIQAGRSPLASCKKHELVITELQLDMAVLLALFHKEQEKLDHQVSRISMNIENSIQDLSRENEEKSADLELIETAVNELTSSESTKRIEERNSTKLVRLRSTKNSVHIDHPIPKTQGTTDTGPFHVNSTSEMNDRDAQEITRPSRQSVVEKEPCFIYQNNNQLFQNSTQQIDLTSSQPTPPRYTGHTTRPSQYSGKRRVQQKPPSIVFAQKSNSNQSIPT